MTVNEFIKISGVQILVEGDDIDAKIEGCYIGDLLSWVMSKASMGDIWLTVMGNINSIAVATLNDVACIVLTENAPLDEIAKKKAEQQGITVLQSEKNSYQLATEIYEAMKA